MPKFVKEVKGGIPLSPEGDSLLPPVSMKYKDLISQDPKICFGKPTIKGTRIPVYILVGMLAEGVEVKEIAEDYGISEEEVRAAALYALDLLFDEARREIMKEKVSLERVRKLLNLAADKAEKTRAKTRKPAE